MFSETVDKVAKASGRPDILADIAGAVNRVLKKAHAKQYFLKDLEEDQLTSTAENFTWDLPRYYRTMQTVRYGPDIFPKQKQPGRVQRGQTQYWYQASRYIVFAGAGAGTSIGLAYFSAGRTYKYYAVGERPAIFDQENGTWQYLLDGSYVSTLGTDVLDEAARLLVSDWLLEEWSAIAYEGALAEIFKLGSDERTRTHFANYNDLLNTLEITEMVGGLGR